MRHVRCECHFPDEYRLVIHLDPGRRIKLQSNHASRHEGFGGLGSAANLPAGLALLSSVYRPGPRKNFVITLYGGCAPFGFFAGILVAGLSGQVIYWDWFFWIVSVSLAATGVVSFFCVPREMHARHGSMDWWGCPTSIPRIFLLVYAVTESSHARGGWASLHGLSGTFLLLLSASGSMICVLRFVIMPEKPSYWPWVFPAMVCATLGIDISYNVRSIFITTNVAKHEQGVAGACVNGVVFLGIAFFLGWADLAVAKTAYLGVRASYKTAFFLRTGCAGVAIVLSASGIRAEKAKSGLTVEEKDALRGRPAAGDSSLQPASDDRVAETDLDNFFKPHFSNVYLLSREHE